MLTGITGLLKEVKEMQWCPSDKGDDTYLHKEEGVHVRGVEIFLKEGYRHEVDNSCHNLNEQHLEAHVVDLE